MPSTARRPRILQVVSYLTLGGAERIALSITEALRDEFDFSLHAVRGLQKSSMGEPLAHELGTLGIPFTLGINIPMRFGGIVTSGIGLARVVRRVKPDLIHLHTEIPEAAYAAMTLALPSSRNIPVVRTLQSTVFWNFCRPIARWCDRRLARAHVVGVSPGCLQTFEQLRRESGACQPLRPPQVIYNGVRSPASSSPPARDKIQPVEIVFGGRFEVQKGTDLLPEILRKVRSPAQGARLTIYGCGTHAGLLRDLTAKPPQGWRVELHDPIPDFASRLNRYDLLIMPSRYEGLALVAIEAALAGTPVVTTDVPGLREVFPPTHPWFSPAGDAASFAAALQSALDNPSHWREVAARSLAHAQQSFTVDIMAGTYRQLYRQMLSPSP